MPILDLTNRKSAEELAKLPAPSNEGLNGLFRGIDKILVKEGGVYDNEAITNNVVLVINDTNQINRLAELMELDESQNGFYCMCAGDYGFELHKDETMVTTIGFHHGRSIRYHGWNSDAAFALKDDLLLFLDSLGLSDPWQLHLAVKKATEAGKSEELEWFRHAPACLPVFFNQFPDFTGIDLTELLENLRQEIPSQNQRIISLLQAFGRTNNFWTDYPLYEELPNTILKTFSLSEVVSAYVSSDRNYKTRRGLGRFLSMLDSKDNRKEFLDRIPVEVIEDILKCFRSQDNARGVQAMLSLQKDKALQ